MCDTQTRDAEAKTRGVGMATATRDTTTRDAQQTAIKSQIGPEYESWLVANQDKFDKKHELAYKTKSLQADFENFGRSSKGQRLDGPEYEQMVMEREKHGPLWEQTRAVQEEARENKYQERATTLMETAALVGVSAATGGIDDALDKVTQQLDHVNDEARAVLYVQRVLFERATALICIFAVTAAHIGVLYHLEYGIHSHHAPLKHPNGEMDVTTGKDAGIGLLNAFLPASTQSANLKSIILFFVTQISMELLSSTICFVIEIRRWELPIKETWALSLRLKWWLGFILIFVSALYTSQHVSLNVVHSVHEVVMDDRCKNVWVEFIHHHHTSPNSTVFR
eukprot:TRINITY_DN53359_c0_g3_i1.p1 TRINITY_DN53359_c0_g3~~TRINITY_DN53359_c0_g3_i1.p1  ORF type:complete len:368 (-),score=40.03 TRINITY_DN53359_c0_g3_i1:28-1041(-)